MSFAVFLTLFYKPECGAAVTLANVTRHFYSESSVADQFDWQPARIKRYLEKKFPVGVWNGMTTVGNLCGQDSIVISDRDLIVFQGDLLPRDLQPDEYPHRPGESGARIQTLTRNDMSARGWNAIYRSRAEIMASLRTPDSEW